MELAQVKTKAKGMGIKPGTMKKAALIHTIQKAEGNFDCFGTAVNYCDQSECCFRDDCIEPKMVN